MKPARPSASSRLVELALGAGVKLFHTSDQVPYVQVPFEDHVEVHAVLGLSFRRFLRHLFYEAEERAVGGEALNAALATLEARAVFEGPEHPVYRRVAPNSGGGVVLDLEAVMHLSAVMAIS